MTKRELRKKYLSARDSMTADERTKKSAFITDRILSSDSYKTAELILCYVSVGSEIDTYTLIESALVDGKRVAVPFCVGKEMRFKEIKSLNNLVEGRFNIPTADDSCPLIEDFKNSLCIVPALSVDKNGNRLGYGGGFYDRFLSIYRDVKCIAVCFDENVSDKLPAEEFDIRINNLITDSRNLEVL